MCSCVASFYHAFRVISINVYTDCEWHKNNVGRGHVLVYQAWWNILFHHAWYTNTSTTWYTNTSTMPGTPTHGEQLITLNVQCFNLQVANKFKLQECELYQNLLRCQLTQQNNYFDMDLDQLRLYSVSHHFFFCFEGNNINFPQSFL